MNKREAIIYKVISHNTILETLVDGGTSFADKSAR
jgi:hypothetical protein